jgi:hypothetical protein
VGSERLSKLHAHVVQSAETDHANFVVLGDSPAPPGRAEAASADRFGFPCRLADS